MNSFTKVVGVVVLLLLLLWFVVPAPPPQEARQDMPWQVETFEDGRSKALGIHLGKMTLAEAAALYGEIEDIALFSAKAAGEEMTLEAYLGNVRNGPLAAKLVLVLAAETGEMQAMAERALKRKTGPSGSYQWVLTTADKEQAIQRLVKSLSYIPLYGELDAEFFRSRFGEPVVRRRLDESRDQWFYPDRGLSILIDANGKEVLQYAQPRDFSLPKGQEAGVAGGGQ